jgi:hypothetical protein
MILEARRLGIIIYSFLKVFLSLNSPTISEARRMTKFLVLWRRSPTTWPANPEEKSKLVQKVGAEFVDGNIKKGKIREHGHFLDGNSGYTMWEAEAADLFRNLSMVWPYYEFEVHEIIPYEKSGKILGEVFEISAKTAKK